MGEGIIEATLTRWLVSAGQHVEIDQPLVEVATDKVDSEIPSPVDGVISKLLYHEGEIPKVGEVIALIETGEDNQPESKEKDIVTTEIIPPLPQQQDSVLPVKGPGLPFSSSTDERLSPLVRSLARQRGITLFELQRIEGSGLDGRITKSDIINYLRAGRLAKISSDHDSPAGNIVTPPNPVNQNPLPEPGDEVVKMDRMRKLIAGNMVRSKKLAPHVTSFLEADITALVAWRENCKEEFYLKEHARLTYTPVFIEVVARALREFPNINISIWNDDSILIRKNINIGFATALPNGNLIVPVIRNADQEDLGSLARKVSDLAERARKNALLPTEIRGGTFTITNIGQYNNLTGTPIINLPEAAILAVGTIAKKPWAVKTGNAYGLAVRDIIMLSLTYDHRVIDGALGGSFLSHIARNLENFNAGMDPSNS